MRSGDDRGAGPRLRADAPAGAGEELTVADSSSGVPLTFVDLAVGIAVGGSAGVARRGAAALRVLAPAGRLSVRLAGSVAGPVADRVGRGRLHSDGQAARAAAVAAGRYLFGTVVRRVLDAVLDQVDLTGQVERRVDLDRLVRHVDLDAVAARLDLDAVAARLDLDAVLARLDLTELVEQRVDLDRLVRHVDLDAIAARLDLEAVLARLDIDAVAARLDLDAVISRLDVDAVAARLDLDAVLARLDLTELVEQRVDLDRIARHLDLDAVAARLDLEAVLARLDLTALANEVVDGIDLPRIIRESTGSVASEGIAGVRIRSMEADRALTHAVDRFLFRRNRAGSRRDRLRPDGEVADGAVGVPVAPVADPAVDGAVRVTVGPVADPAVDGAVGVTVAPLADPVGGQPVDGARP